jgi:2-amino-4-hydroxy-6-hydroxymethyldihydropteridine diphosphokinase
MVIYLALGSNLGDRRAHLEAAVSGLSQHEVEPVRSSSVYKTEPKELLDQPWFMNCVLEAATTLQPVDLLKICLDVERENGRLRTGKNAPRTLDIDIIFYGRQVVQTPELVVPHPRYATRRFVLEPLAEIAPSFRDPILAVTVQELLAASNDAAAVLKAGPPLF